MRRSTCSDSGGVASPSMRKAPAIPHMSANLLGPDEGDQRPDVATTLARLQSRCQRVGEMTERDADGLERGGRGRPVPARVTHAVAGQHCEQLLTGPRRTALVVDGRGRLVADVPARGTQA